MTSEEELAFHAQQLLDNPVIRAIFQEIEAEQVAKWRNSDDLVSREEAFRTLRSLDDLRTALRTKLHAPRFSKRPA